MIHKVILLALGLLIVSECVKIYGHTTFSVKSFSVINYTNFIPLNPIFILELSYSMKENHRNGHKHQDIKLSVKIDNKVQIFTLGEDILFKRVSEDTIRLFAPWFHTIAYGKGRIVSFSFSEGKKVVFKTNIAFSVSNTTQTPIIISEGINEIEIPRKITQQVRFFFIYQSPVKALVIDSYEGLTNVLITQPTSRIKGLYSADHTFFKEGEYLVVIGDSQITIRVYFDKNPPTFRILNPTNGSVFYRTNDIHIKWLDPIDISGIDFSKSYLSISDSRSKVFEYPLYKKFNRESEINPYEIVSLSLSEGDYECSIGYTDLEGNFTNQVVKFKVVSYTLDREKPFFKRIEIEGSKKLSENKFVVKGRRVSVFLEFSDGDYGSGVKFIHYVVNGKKLSESVFGNVKYLSFEIDSNTNEVSMWLEDMNGNFSETNFISLIR